MTNALKREAWTFNFLTIGMLVVTCFLDHWFRWAGFIWIGWIILASPWGWIILASPWGWSILWRLGGINRRR